MIARQWLCVLGYASGAGIFSKQVQCSNSRDKGCREVLAGLVSLNTDEAFEFETFNVKQFTNEKQQAPTEHEAGNDPLKDVTVSLRIEKSPLLIAYDLQYIKDVVGGLSEQVYQYSWSASGGGSSVFENEDFDPQRCLKNHNDVIDSSQSDPTDLSLPDEAGEARKLIEAGQVCGCKDTGWGTDTYSKVHRSDLNCNAWPAVFRPSSTTWASRHCPKITGPRYSAYSIFNWHWDFQIKVTVEWIAMPSHKQSVGGDNSRVKKVYLLSWASPEAYDEEFDFRFRIVFSLPQSGSLPPDLNQILLVPHIEDPSTQSATETPGSSDNTNRIVSNLAEPVAMINKTQPKAVTNLLERMPAASIRLNNLRTESLLLDDNLVDLSGKTCDKVGVSLFTWTQNMDRNWVASDEFCQKKAGQCLRNQPNDWIRKDKDALSQGKTPEHLLLYKRLEGWSPFEPLMLTGPVTDLFMYDNANKSNAGIDDDTILARPTAIAWPTDVAHTTSLELFLNSSEIAWMTGNAKGSFIETSVEVIKPTTHSQILCSVRNDESYPSKFTVGSRGCAATGTENDSTGMPQNSPLSIAPISRSIAGNAIDVFTLSLARLTDNSEASFSCHLILWNSRGEEIDSKDINVTFSHRPLSVATFEQPEHSQRNVTVERIDDLAFSSQNPAHYFRGMGEKFPLLSERCDCQLLNLWCIAWNFSGCAQWVKEVSVVAGICAVGVLTVLICGPSLVSCGIFGVIQGCHFVSKRIKAMRFAAKVAVTQARKSQGNSTLPTQANTPVNDEDLETAGNRLHYAVHSMDAIPSNVASPPCALEPLNAFPRYASPLHGPDRSLLVAVSQQQRPKPRIPRDRNCSKLSVHSRRNLSENKRDDSAYFADAELATATPAARRNAHQPKLVSNHRPNTAHISSTLPRAEPRLQMLPSSNRYRHHYHYHQQQPPQAFVKSKRPSTHSHKNWSSEHVPTPSYNRKHLYLERFPAFPKGGQRNTTSSSSANMPTTANTLRRDAIFTSSSSA